MSRKQAECLLAAVIFARSTSLLFAKIGLNSFTPLNLLAVRFCLAFAVLAVIFWKKLRAATKTDLWHGTVLGAAVASLLLESPHLPGTAREWGVILALALVCSCFGFTFQPVAQRYTTAERAAQLCAVNPLSTAVLSAVFLHETMDILGIVGAALILCGIVLHNYQPRKAASRTM